MNDKLFLIILCEKESLVKKDSKISMSEIVITLKKILKIINDIRNIPKLRGLKY